MCQCNKLGQIGNRRFFVFWIAWSARNIFCVFFVFSLVGSNQIVVHKTHITQLSDFIRFFEKKLFLNVSETLSSTQLK